MHSRHIPDWDLRWFALTPLALLKSLLLYQWSPPTWKSIENPGMINYHGKFIRNLSSILQPLNQFLQGNQEFKWSPRCEEALKRPRSHSHLQMYWCIMTQAFLLFLRSTQASLASEQSYFTTSLMVMSDLLHIPPGPWTRLRKTTVRLRRKAWRLFLGGPNFTCISLDASSLCELITSPCWTYLL